MSNPFDKEELRAWLKFTAWITAYLIASSTALAIYKLLIER